MTSSGCTVAFDGVGRQGAGGRERAPEPRVTLADVAGDCRVVVRVSFQRRTRAERMSGKIGMRRNGNRIDRGMLGGVMRGMKRLERRGCRLERDPEQRAVDDGARGFQTRSHRAHSVAIIP